MHWNAGVRAAAFIGVMGGALLLMSGCGVAQGDYDAAKAQLAAKEQEVARLQQQLQNTQGVAGQETTSLKQQLAARDKEIADLKAGSGSLVGKAPLIWTETGPTPAPRPTATPAPPGYVAPTPVPPPAEWVNEVIPFTFYVEHLTGHQTSTVIQYPSCVPNSQFRQGAHIVWRFEVVDTSTGKRLTSLDSPTIKLVLPNGQEVAARYSKRGGIGPWMWSTAWDVPADYPLGTLDYQIVVKSKDGRTGTFDQDTLALVRPASATLPNGSSSAIQIVK